MAVKIRLKRMGKKRQPSYRVVVADGRSPRDGRFIEQIGRYDPLTEPSVVEIDNDRALDWLSKGAQPTDAARKLLEISGAWSQFRATKGEVHTIAAIPEVKAKVSKKQQAAAAAAEAAAAEPAEDAPQDDAPVEGAAVEAATVEEATEAAAPEEASAPEEAADEAAPEVASDDEPAEEAEGEES
ncbi:MAG: 30S ribosomal protein S16 [Acidimicrobiia bacterium]